MNKFILENYPNICFESVLKEVKSSSYFEEKVILTIFFTSKFPDLLQYL